MASELKSYVEKFLLNPAASFNVDDEGNEETNAQIVDSLADDEGVEKRQQQRSVLRARNEALSLETEARYKGKKVTRKQLKEDVSFDPELTKYFVAGSDESDFGEEDNQENSDVNEEDSSHSDTTEKNQVGEEQEEEDDDDDAGDSEEDDESAIEEEEDVDAGGSEEEEEDDGGGGEEEEDSNAYEEDEEAFERDQPPQSDGLIYNGDFSRFAEDFEEDEDDDDENSSNEMGDVSEEDEENPSVRVGGMEKEGTESTEMNMGVSIKKFQSMDEDEEIKKAQCVKEQLAVYDSLFEMRICMQKGVTGANQLPQFNTYRSFLQENDPNYMKNLSVAKSSAKKILNILLEAQISLLNQNPETKYLMNENKKQSATGSDEEITSSEDEEISQSVVPQSKGKKRKLKLKEYGDILSKRHASLLPFRDETLTRWYEKTKLLSSTRGRDKFSGFEVSALQQLNNILLNKAQLVRRTQLTGVTRGTAYHVLGTNDEDITEADREEYDAEIFDDGDFYSRALEEMLKSKISLSDDMSDVSRKWIEIQKLRKKAKKKVDTKASKGRKLRFEVISKLQQYLAPCNPPQMDDGAMNTLFTSLFGKGIKVQENGSL